MSGVITRAGVLLALVISVLTVATCLADDEKPYELGGRIAPQYRFGTYPDNSVFRDAVGSTSHDFNLDARLVFSYKHKKWDFKADYQFIALWGDTVELTRAAPPEAGFLLGGIASDRRRLFDLTHVFTDDGNFAALNRLDRLSFGHTTETTVVRFGRQAITWGNGLVYTPMDIFNPFDPAAVDKEFKTGDDMLYGQYLLNSGDDMQGVMVFRRNLMTGDVEAGESSLAVKFHGLIGQGEIDALVGKHYGDVLVAIGGNRSVGGAVWRGDGVVAFTSDNPVLTAVTSVSYSWTTAGKNTSGVLEYFFNGFGQRGSEYAPADLAGNPDLVERIGRGELFTLGRHYLAASAMFELTPLFLLTPNLFLNIEDPSALVQLVTQNDLREDLIFFGAVNIPIGADGTEFGGIPGTMPGRFLSSGPGLFLQLRWYF